MTFSLPSLFFFSHLLSPSTPTSSSTPPYHLQISSHFHEEHIGPKSIVQMQIIALQLQSCCNTTFSINCFVIMCIFVHVILCFNICPWMTSSIIWCTLYFIFIFFTKLLTHYQASSHVSCIEKFLYGLSVFSVKISICPIISNWQLSHLLKESSIFHMFL